MLIKRFIQLPFDRLIGLIDFSSFIILFLTLVYTPISLSAQQDSSLADAAMHRDVQLLRTLLSDENIDPDALGEFGTPALHWTVNFEDIASTQLLLQAGADPNLSTSYGNNALNLAVASGNSVLVQLLLSSGANPNSEASGGISVLMRAAEIGRLSSVTHLIENGAQLGYQEPHFGQTALMFAARAGHLEIVNYLLKKGADQNVSTTIGQVPSWIRPNSVPGFGYGVGIIRGGVPADRGLRPPAPGGMTPLLYAVRHNHGKVVERLLDTGADINKAEANNITPLLMAISNNHLELAHLLIDRGANINTVDWYGRSPLWEAVNVRNLYLHNETFENYIDREPFIPLIKTLLDRGANVNVRTAETPPFRHHLLIITGSLEWVDFTGQTPFLTAALAGDNTVMKLLLDGGADPLIETYQGTNALMAAAGVNWVVAQTYTEGPEALLVAVKLCWQLGMDVNEKNSMGLSAIHGAANRGSNDIIKFLVEKGARNKSMLDSEGRSPMDWASGVFLATHPADPKPSTMKLLSELMLAEENE